MNEIANEILIVKVNLSMTKKKLISRLLPLTKSLRILHTGTQ